MEFLSMRRILWVATGQPLLEVCFQLKLIESLSYLVFWT